tara:strand:+ start:183 stop:704 length:522 start_codon:yes stop_codon:yes gene_type:complete
MAIFSNKIVDVYYTDQSLSNVTILYNYEKDGETLVGQYRLLVDETEEQFQDLMREVTYQDIEINTIELHRKYNDEMKSIITDETRRLAKEDVRSEFAGMGVDIDEETFKIFFEYDSEKHGDQLFRCKIYLFNLDIVKNGSKALKSKIRKAEDLLELCRLLSAEKRRIERKESK